MTQNHRPWPLNVKKGATKRLPVTSSNADRFGGGALKMHHLKMQARTLSVLLKQQDVKLLELLRAVA